MKPLLSISSLKVFFWLSAEFVSIEISFSYFISYTSPYSFSITATDSPTSFNFMAFIFSYTVIRILFILIFLISQLVSETLFRYSDDKSSITRLISHREYVMNIIYIRVYFVRLSDNTFNANLQCYRMTFILSCERKSGSWLMEILLYCFDFYFLITLCSRTWLPKNAFSYTTRQLKQLIQSSLFVYGSNHFQGFPSYMQ